MAAYFNRCLQVLRTGERAQNFFALTEVRDQTDNQMARVNAVKTMQQLDAEGMLRPISDRETPGVTIRIVSEAPAPPAIDVSPTIIPAPFASPPLPAPEPEPRDPIFRAPKLFGR